MQNAIRCKFDVQGFSLMEVPNCTQTREEVALNWQANRQE